MTIMTELTTAPYTVTFVSPTLSGNLTANFSWVYVNVTASENLNASLLEWGNSSGFTNVSMVNGSMSNWFANMSGLPDGTYNYTVWTRSGDLPSWSQSERMFVTVDTNPPYELRACQELGIRNGSYVLVQNVSADGTCFTIKADNVTLDGLGNTIDYAKISAGYAVGDGGGYDNVTIKNLRIVQNDPEVTEAYGVYAVGMGGGAVTGNAITAFGKYAYGVYLESSASIAVSGNGISAFGPNNYGAYFYLSGANALSNNTVKTSGDTSPGIWLDPGSNSNSIDGNSVETSGDGSAGIAVMRSDSNAITNNTIVTAYNTNASFSAGSIGIDLDSSSYNNVSNNRITSSAEMSPGLEMDSNSNSNAVENNSIRTSGDGSAGIIVESSNSNALSNNTVASFGTESPGIVVAVSASNNITGGSIVSKNHYDYRLESAGTTNAFESTNFTQQRRIWFNDENSWFNYNESGIWLKTSVPAGLRGINRTLEWEGWSKSGIAWNDTNENGATDVNYAIAGLLANTQYHVRNVSAGGMTYAYMLTTDQHGTLPAFAIGLGGNTNLMVHVCHDCMCNLTASGGSGRLMENAMVTVYNEAGGVISDFQLNSSVASREFVFDGARKYDMAYRLQSGNALEIKNASMMMNVTINPQFVDAYAGPLPQYTSARSYAIALDDSEITFERAEMTLPISGAANRILHCLSWNYSGATCSSWESKTMSDYNAAVNSTHVRLNVTRFDAYMAAYYEAPAVQQQQAGGGGGGGRGSGGGAATSGLYAKSVSAELDGLTLKVELLAGLPGASVTAAWLPAVPVPRPAPTLVVYRYMNVTKTGFNDSDISNATIGFRVGAGWLNLNNVTRVYLARYEDGWKKLRTDHVNSTGEYDEYRAHANAFSYFAIVGEKAKTSSEPLAANETGPAGENATQNPLVAPLLTQQRENTKAGRVTFPSDSLAIAALAGALLLLWGLVARKWNNRASAMLRKLNPLRAHPGRSGKGGLIGD